MGTDPHDLVYRSGGSEPMPTENSSCGIPTWKAPGVEEDAAKGQRVRGKGTSQGRRRQGRQSAVTKGSPGHLQPGGGERGGIWGGAGGGGGRTDEYL